MLRSDIRDLLDAYVCTNGPAFPHAYVCNQRTWPLSGYNSSNVAKKKKKDKSAQALVKKRWDKMTAEERSAYAKKIAETRWAKKKKP